MKEQLRKLIKLQRLDKTLYELETERDQIPGMLVECDQKETKLKSGLEATEAELTETVARHKELEKEVESIKSRLRKAESRLMGAKNDREYRAANAEIQEGKDAVKSNEDVLLGVMERQEALQGHAEKLKALYQEAAEEATETRKRLTKRAKQINAELGKMSQGRDELIEGVDPELMSQYDFIRKARQGVALAPVTNGTCMACHIQIPPQQFNELLRVDKLMNCPSCRRILYWAEAECLADC